MKRRILLLLLPMVCIICSCHAAPVSDPFPDVEEVVHAYHSGDRLFYGSLREVEQISDLIVEAVVKEVVDQHVDTRYDPTFGKFVPGFGYTAREISVTKVHKGEVRAGDALTLLESHYVWTTDEGTKQLVLRSPLHPAKTNGKYLLFLRHHEALGGYWPTGDYQGRHALPSREIRDKMEAGTLAQADLDVYGHETQPYLMAIYHEVFDKYFSQADEQLPEEEKLRLRNERVKSVHDPDMTLERLKEMVPVNMAAEEAVRLLGDQYNLELARASWEEVIRYDFTGDASYRFVYRSLHQDIADIDFDGLESGRMKFQVFLYPDDAGWIRFSSIAYMGDDGNVHLYQRFADGSSFDDALMRVE